MEYEQEYERKYASSTLLRQVKEQNKDFCDVPVHVGTWVKRFHSCILVESGFFDTLFHTSEFREHVTGVIEIRERSSNIVDEAIQFLYNVEPNLNKDNIGEFVDIAEFLMIPRLKAFCVKWLEQTEKSITLIAISLPLFTLYDLDVPSVSDYIKKHLIELMNGTELLNIDANSLQSR
ncbi:KLHL7-like protein [Mya arenaria]|uniref:KLHL7-like protein n=1 Tax=Mya arenaria TaxID=6604 RepID=A0ABY7ETQ7_MYAAR|nr:KLHL7-like protein [Mya arenaria]